MLLLYISLVNLQRGDIQFYLGSKQIKSDTAAAVCTSFLYQFKL